MRNSLDVHLDCVRRSEGCLWSLGWSIHKVQRVMKKALDYLSPSGYSIHRKSPYGNVQYILSRL